MEPHTAAVVLVAGVSYVLYREYVGLKGHKQVLLWNRHFWWHLPVTI